MKIKQATFYKEFKKGLPNFSNITASMSITVEVGEGEELNTTECWEYVNNQIVNQADLDSSWIKTTEHKNHFTTQIKTPKTTQERS